MKRLFYSICILGIALNLQAQEKVEIQFAHKDGLAIKLPAPDMTGDMSVEAALNTRRSERVFMQDAIQLADLSQILWAAQGITWRLDTVPRQWKGEKWLGGVRTAPSAGALYPIELYVAVTNVETLEKGLYKYNPLEHTITKTLDGDKREAILNAGLMQSAIKNGKACIIIAGNFGRTEFKYKGRANQYVYIESGAVCQNIYLQCEALNIGTVFIGAIKEDLLRETLGIPDFETPIGLMPIGYSLPKEEE